MANAPVQKKGAARPKPESRGSAAPGITPAREREATGGGQVARSNLVVVLISLILLGLITWRAAVQKPGGDPYAPAPGLSSWRGWIEPIERNRFLRLPSIRSDLKSVTFNPDGLRGWAVGSGGMIVHTQDGGLTWMQQYPKRAGSAGPAADVVAPAAKLSLLDWIPSAHAEIRSQSQTGAPPASAKALLPPQTLGENAGAPTSDTKTTTQQKAINPSSQKSPIVPLPNAATSRSAAAPSTTDQTSTGAAESGKSPAAAPATRPSPSSSGGGGSSFEIDQVTLRHVFFLADGERGWAVGDVGAVLSTINGGLDWTLRTTGVANGLNAVTFAADGIHGWAVGDSGVVLTTENGGIRWAKQILDDQIALNAVVMAEDAKRGWIAGSQGGIFITRNGGADWQAAARVTTQSLSALWFAADGQTGWAVGAEGVALSTRNGGLDWQLHKIESLFPLIAIWFTADGQRGFAANTIGELLETRDGGANWQKHPNSPGEAIRSIAFNERNNRAWAVGSRGAITVTPDGGETWQAQSSGARGALRAISMTDSGKGWVVGRKGLVLRTDDGGADWRVQASGTTADLFSIAVAADGKRGWAVGETGTIISSTDGGESWLLKKVRDAALYSVTFSGDGQRGWAGGMDKARVLLPKGALLATRDGGATWLDQSSGMNAIPGAIAFAADGRHGWLAGGQASLPRVVGRLNSTNDGGASWSDVSVALAQTAKPAILTAIAASADGQGVIAVGSEGAVLSTRDGGINWIAPKAATNAALHSVVLTGGGAAAWAVGDSGTMLASADGGTNWKAVLGPTQSDLASISFGTGGARGWVVGADNTILVTQDSGQLWTAAVYGRYPARWFYVVGLLILAATAFLCWGNILIAKPQQVVASIVDKSETDEPISRVDQDRLGFGPLAQSLASYLRNEATNPPLTISISAPWGRGKSSVMRMLKTEMEAVGVKSVWFNAWHHQQEEVLMAALLESIRRQALPFWLSYHGLRFRLRLLWRRLRAHPYIGFAGFSILLVAALHFGQQLWSWIGAGRTAGLGWIRYLLKTIADRWDTGDDSVLPELHLFDKLFEGKWAEALGTIASSVLGKPEILMNTVLVGLLLVVLFALFAYGLRAFPDSPAVLLASAAKQFKLGDVTAQTSYRQRFKMHFADVCEALRPRTMLIFIDDLDRCDPGKTAEMLESINYLVNSGPCFIVLGMARDIVETNLELHYKETADAFKEKAGNKGAGFVPGYLRKLINLEVRVPQMSADMVASLLEIEKRQAESRSTWRKRADRWESVWRGWAKVTVSWAIVLAAISWAGYQLGQRLDQWDERRIKTLKEQRDEAELQMARIGDFERRAAVALDFAHGKEKKIAGDLYQRFNVAVAGLEFSLPVERTNLAQPIGGDVCDKSTPAPADGAIAQSAKSPTPQGSLADSPELACWQQRALAARAAETQYENAKAARQSAVIAKARDEFKRLRRLEVKALKAAEAAEKLAGTGVSADAGIKPVSTDAPPPTAAEAPQKPAAKAVHADIIDHQAGATTWPYWVALLLLLGVGGAFVMRRDPFILRDEPQFVESLRIWHELLAVDTDLAVPREIKRFQNRARYFATRLRGTQAPRGWFDRLIDQLDKRTDDSRETDKAALKTRIPEEVIVGLTAIYQVFPQLLRDYSPDSWSRFRSGFESNGLPPAAGFVTACIEQHDAFAVQQQDEGRDFAHFPRERHVIRVFLEIVEELPPDVEESPSRTPVMQ